MDDLQELSVSAVNPQPDASGNGHATTEPLPVDERVESLAAAVVAEVRRRYVRPVATYRLQFHPGFTFRDAAAIAAYLKRLGISHVYASPYLRPKTGSTDGYSVCDPTQLNPELGGEPAYQQFLDALRAEGLSQILDIVPNHMSATVENPWWFDVLENGPGSAYANFFDIDWNPVKPELTDRVLLPVLGQQFGVVLEEGQLRVEFYEGAFFVRYCETRLPLGPKTLVPLLNHRLDELRAALGEEHVDFLEYQSIMTAIDHLPPPSARDVAAIRERQREVVIIKRRLRELSAATEAVRAHLDRCLADYNGTPGDPASFDLLDRLLSAQSYRLCHWRASFDEVNYRRFFDINDLVAIDMQLPEVFWRTHQVIRKLLVDGAIAGVRIDHIDGLFDPDQYLWRLQWAYLADLAHAAQQQAQAEAGGAAAATSGEEAHAAWRALAAAVIRRVCEQLQLPAPDDRDLPAILGVESPQPRSEEPGVHPAYERAGGELPLYVVAEKILGPDEPLPTRWPLAGTTGYDFVNELNGLFVSPAGFQEIVRTYGRFTSNAVDVEQIVREAKMLILRASMASELQMLAHRLNRLSEQHRRSRDFTLNMLRYALRDVLTCFPVYRVYPHHDGISDRDRRFVELAVAKARRRNPAWDPAVFDFIREVLLLQHPTGLSPAAIREREAFVGRFQQVTSPVMAKGIEDTTFYVHVPLVSVNEVGGDVKQPCVSVAAFHRQNEVRQAHYRQTLLATSTHDTKRSEDVRARLNVLSEIPGEWRREVSRWARLNRRLRREVDGEPAPSRKDEYLFYQALLGIWPVAPPNAAEREQLIARLQAYMEKATREAKQRTSWINPNPAYDAAVKEFVAGALAAGDKNRFLLAFGDFHGQIVTAGFHNAIAQVVLKILSPGVPDVYQGQEIWDFSLVDPDNRRAVDYPLRSRLLDELEAWHSLPAAVRRERMERLVCTPTDPLLKLLVTHTLLRLRHDYKETWLRGQYEPIAGKGPLADHLIAFGWRSAGEPHFDILAVVPRFIHALARQPQAEMWSETCLEGLQGHGTFRNVFTEQEQELAAGMPVAPLLAGFPVGVWRRKVQ